MPTAPLVLRPGQGNHGHSHHVRVPHSFVKSKFFHKIIFKLTSRLFGFSFSFNAISKPRLYNSALETAVYS